PELVYVDARRYFVDPVDVSDDLVEDSADVCRADEGRARLIERSAPPLGELLVAAHRVLELGAVRLDCERSARGGPDWAAEQDVVCKDEVGRELGAHSRGIRLDVAVALGAGQVLQQPRLGPGIAVEDEGGQQVVRQLGPQDARAGEVVGAGVPLLADDDDLVPQAGPRARERACVHVRPRAAEQVAVPEDDLHGASLADLARADAAIRSGGSRARAGAPRPDWTCELARRP